MSEHNNERLCTNLTTFCHAHPYDCKETLKPGPASCFGGFPVGILQSRPIHNPSELQRQYLQPSAQGPDSLMISPTPILHKHARTHTLCISCAHVNYITHRKKQSRCHPLLAHKVSISNKLYDICPIVKTKSHFTVTVHHSTAHTSNT